MRSIQDKNRELLHHIGTASETARTISGSTARDPQRVQLTSLRAGGTHLKMELMLQAFKLSLLQSCIKGYWFAIYQT